MENSIKEYIEKSRDESTERLIALGKIPAPSGEEDKRAAYCLAWFKSMGGENAYMDEAKNVVCPLNCEGKDSITVFMAHTDVVFPDTDELPVKREDNFLYAPGIGDDTANLINLMMGAKFLLERKIPLKKGLLIVANSCEEGLGNLKGSKQIFKDFGDRIDEFYSFDGYLPGCTDTPVGSYRYRITARAQGGHSFGDFGRENPIATLASLIGELYAIEPPAEERTTYNVGRIEGGTTVNSIPQEVSALYEFRSPSQTCLEIMEKKYQSIISRYQEQGHKIESEILGIRPGRGEMDEETFNAWTDENLEVIRKYYKGEVKRTMQSTDANIPLSRGILANTIGTIKGGGAHTREEWVDLDSLPMGLAIVLDLLMLRGAV